jgi:hypothetical protein
MGFARRAKGAAMFRALRRVGRVRSSRIEEQGARSEHQRSKRGKIVSNPYSFGLRIERGNLTALLQVARIR